MARIIRKNEGKFRDTSFSKECILGSHVIWTIGRKDVSFSWTNAWKTTCLWSPFIIMSLQYHQQESRKKWSLCCLSCLEHYYDTLSLQRMSRLVNDCQNKRRARRKQDDVSVTRSQGRQDAFVTKESKGCHDVSVSWLLWVSSHIKREMSLLCQRWRWQSKKDRERDTHTHTLISCLKCCCNIILMLIPFMFRTASLPDIYGCTSVSLVKRDVISHRQPHDTPFCESVFERWSCYFWIAITVFRRASVSHDRRRWCIITYNMIVKLYYFLSLESLNGLTVSAVLSAVLICPNTHTLDHLSLNAILLVCQS